MKNIIVGFCMSICTVLLIIVLSVQNETTMKRQELKQTITHTMETTVDEVMKENNYQIKDVNDFMYTFQQYFFSNIQSNNVDIALKVMDLDLESGLLKLEAICRYKQVDFKHTQKEFTVEKTILFNEKERRI